MNPYTILDRINLRHGTAYRLAGKYQHGENQGAFALLDAAGAAFVLKYLQRAGWVARLEHARRITRRLGERGVAAPRYELVGELEGDWTYCIQNALPGSAARSLTVAQARQLIAWIELQAEQGLATEPNWSHYVHAVVFDGESGWSESLRAYSPETQALLGRMLSRVERSRDERLVAADSVHGDLALENVLLDNGQVSGIVDWDAAGRGDRALDVAKLLYYCYDNRPVRDLLQRHVLALRGPERMNLHLVYCMLAQLDWSIHHHDARAVAGLVAQAHAIIDEFS